MWLVGFIYMNSWFLNGKLPSLKLTISHLKKDGVSKFGISKLPGAYFQVRLLLVSGRVVGKYTSSMGPDPPSSQVLGWPHKIGSSTSIVIKWSLYIQNYKTPINGRKHMDFMGGLSITPLFCGVMGPNSFFFAMGFRERIPRSLGRKFRDPLNKQQDHQGWNLRVSRANRRINFM